MKNEIDLKKIKSAYEQYSRGAEKKALDARIIENNRWYKQQYTEFSSREDEEKKKGGNRTPQSKSGYTFSAIAHKHADAMDNFPDINVLPREARDEEEAKKLSCILPCVLELSGFRETYSKNWWYKLKNGTACYGVFWNPRLLGGLGDIEIKKIDLLNLAWQPGITDIQDSKYVFYSYYMDKTEFVNRYGEEKLSLAENSLEIETYSGTRERDEDESVLVVDGYYKKTDASGAAQLHLVKFSGENVLEQTEGEEAYFRGLYNHAKYPFVFDVMYPNEDSPAGFGVVDVVKNTQAYIDKLDALMSENATIIGKTRYLVSDSSAVNEEEFLDMDKTIVHVAGSLDERHFRQIEGKALPAQIVEQRAQKIQELKEVIGNRDFQQGGTTGGVTSGSALTILQQAGDKISRDLIDSSYRSYRRICEMAIELMRQFYDVERSFRITGEGGEHEFTSYSNHYIAQMEEREQADGQDTALYRPEFDVVLSVQRSNPFTKEQQNQTILSLWGQGFFNPQALDMSLLALSAMQFDGKEKLMQALEEKKEQMQAQAQAQAQETSHLTGGAGLPQAEGELVEIPLG